MILNNTVFVNGFTWNTHYPLFMKYINVMMVTQMLNGWLWKSVNSRVTYWSIVPCVNQMTQKKRAAG